RKHRKLIKSTYNCVKKLTDKHDAGKPQVVTKYNNSDKSNRTRGGETPAKVIDQGNRTNENADLGNSIKQGVQVKEVIKRQIVKSAPRAIQVEIIKSASRTKK